MDKLVSRLSLPEALGLSLSVISPTVGAAFNITLVVAAAGPAAPLAFAIGTVAIACVALSFMAFAHRVASAGSAYAYITHTFGSRAGFIAGWTLLLTYLCFATGFAALVGSFTAAALKALGLDIGQGWLLLGGLALLCGWWLAYRDARLAGRLMLALELAAVVGILGLCVAILRQVDLPPGHFAQSFRPSAGFGGWTGLGFAMVFSILSCSGFEGAATLGEETVNPRRNIPITLLATVVGSGLFFVFVAYCELAGFGPDGLQRLAGSQAPLDELATRYVSPQLAIGLDLLAAASCFSGIIGGMSATARVLFALGRAGLAPRLGGVHPVHGTPALATTVVAIVITATYVLWAPWAGSGNFYSYTSTIGVLALMLIYIGVGAAEIVESLRGGALRWAAVCALGPALLLWVLYRNIWPVPEYPNNLWPYLVLAWAVAAFAVMRLRPAVTQAPLPDYF
jgi:amino acid transporter